MHDGQLADLLRRLAVDNPLTTSVEGLDDGCFWCGAYVRFGSTHPGRTDYEWADHEADCEWVEARQALGLPLGRHTVKAVAAPKPTYAWGLMTHDVNPIPTEAPPIPHLVVQRGGIRFTPRDDECEVCGCRYVCGHTSGIVGADGFSVAYRHMIEPGTLPVQERDARS